MRFNFGRVPEEKLNARTWNLPRLQSFQLQNEETHIRLGLGEWSSDLFRGTLYPPKSHAEDFLRMYTTQFDSVELNSTFYSVPSVERVKSWSRVAQEVNPLFKFCPKLPQMISHTQALLGVDDLVKIFLHSIEHLGENLGPCFLQLPEFFCPQSYSTLLDFLSKWPQDIKLAIELRNKAWFINKNIFEDLSNVLNKKKMGLVVTDTPGIPQVLHQKLTCDFVMIRFVSNAHHQSNDERLALWVYRLGEYSGHGIKESYFFLQDHEEVCLSVMKKFAGSIGARVRIPEGFKEESNQLSLF